MDSEYLVESARLEQQLADAYRAYRHYFETVPYPSTEEEWAELDALRDAITQASEEWGDYCLNNKHLR